MIVIKNNFFTKEDIRVFKGIAIILMLLHHFFGYPGWYINGITVSGINDIDFFRYAVNPVSIFAFITGYTYFYTKNKNYNYSFTKIFDVFIPYWVIFFLLMIIGFITNTYTFNLKDFGLEFFAINFLLMRFCWYVLFYIIVMLLMPLISKFLDKCNIIESLLITVILVLIFQCILVANINCAKIVDITYNLGRFFPVVLIGYVCAKHSVFYTIDENFIKNRYMKFILCLIPIYFVLKLRQLFPNILIFNIQYIEQYYPVNLTLDIVYIPILLYLIKTIIETKRRYFAKIIAFVGKYSLLIWFIHCIFFNVSQSIFMPILFFNSNPIIITLWGLLLSLIVAMMINPLISILIKYKNKLFKKQTN